MFKRYLKISFALTLIFVLCLGDSINPQDRKSDTEKHKEIARHWGQAVSSHDFDKMSEVMSVDYIWHFPGRDIVGWDNVKIAFEGLFKAFPDFHLSPVDIVSDGEKVVVRWNIRGTHRGEFLGVKPTNKSIEYTSISMDQVTGGKFIEGWEIYDELGLRKQLGFDVVFRANLAVKDTIEAKSERKSVPLQKLVQTRIKLRQALLNRDIKTLERLWADDYVLTTRTGKVLTKPQRIASLKSGRLRYLKFAEQSEVKIRLYGNTAVVTGLGATLTSRDGKEIVSGKKRFTEVFIYQDGSWRMVARHASTIEQ